MSRENVEAAERIYAARLRGDVDALLAELHRDVEWRPHLSSLGGRSVRGHAGVRYYLASLAEEWEDFRQELERLFDAGDEVVAFLNTYGRGRASGIELQPRVAHVLRFKDGKCVESVTYLDRAEALRAAGAASTDTRGALSSDEHDLAGLVFPRPQRWAAGLGVERQQLGTERRAMRR